jgi:hypothetical protein
MSGTQVTWKHAGQDKAQSSGYGRQNEEYIADFDLLVKRCLTAKDLRLFKFYFLDRIDYTFCCRYLRMDKGPLFHSIYRIEACLGRICRDLHPFPLFPLDKYFS